MYLTNQKEVEARVLEEAKYFISTKSTVRKTSDYFKRSKSTIHQDLTKRLPHYNNTLAKKVRTIMDINIAERAIRGGKATKMKYILKT